jgi:hypothetical protein
VGSGAVVGIGVGVCGTGVSVAGAVVGTGVRVGVAGSEVGDGVYEGRSVTVGSGVGVLLACGDGVTACASSVSLACTVCATVVSSTAGSGVAIRGGRQDPVARARLPATNRKGILVSIMTPLT